MEPMKTVESAMGNVIRFLKSHKRPEPLQKQANDGNGACVHLCHIRIHHQHFEYYCFVIPNLYTPGGDNSKLCKYINPFIIIIIICIL